ncbi:MAG TPA: tyrosine-type recombinase/integrase [Aeriscardovia aeriphila]|uniref:Tyrosine-type recombinase/integrase n=1 Tax=Aeriscardovia aeriphila TaxID=218139 RepID=A0A921FUS9_9BIFI|nr:tyrosine-type recombinase/integrase [Aeriscardovia aeriphila]
MTVHSLRHAYASMGIAAGADIKTLQRQLGYSSASITLDMYASLFPLPPVGGRGRGEEHASR